MINQEFNQLNQKTGGYVYNFSSALLPHNGIKNRYNDVMPVEHSRVILSENQDESCGPRDVGLKEFLGGSCSTSSGDYINANFVETGNEKFICTQSPTIETCIDFWKMIWDNNTTVICALNRLVENRIVKGILYWPETFSKHHYGAYTVELISTYPMNNLCITLRILDLYYQNERRQIYHLHYEGWPDYGVPESSVPIRELVKLATFYNRKPSGPMVVHCSAGIGRSGTFMAIVTIMSSSEFKKIIEERIQSKTNINSGMTDNDLQNTDSLESSPNINATRSSPYPRSNRNHGRPTIKRTLKPKLTPPITPSQPYKEEVMQLLSQFNIMDLVYSMRQQRNPGIVQTEQQYRFIYTALHDEILSPIIVSENVARVIMKFNPKKRRYRSRSQPVFKTPKRQKMDYHQTYMKKHTSNNLSYLINVRKSSSPFNLEPSFLNSKGMSNSLTSSAKDDSNYSLIQSGPIIL